ncbi:MAG: PEP-utilizing enzyme [Nitrospirae bacterium]|nr:PEP-utilizing enzyme [Nitrospirota bacterium]
MKNFVEHLKSILGFSDRNAADYPSFKILFTGFRQVLDDHNRAIEIIADMGDKLGGDYLFDINYIKSAYSELFNAVYSSMQNFDTLTRNKYLKLHDVFDRIDTQIKSMIFDASPTSGERVLFYEDITWDRYSEAGGKNANLAELKNYLKLNVPDGFAVTTHAFDEFIRHNGLEVKIESLNANPPTPLFNPPLSKGLHPPSPSLGKGGLRGVMLNELHDLIINGEIPSELSAAIDDAIERLKEKFKGGLACAVRSSATEEDSEHSFAGQFETVLNVPLKGRAVKDAYKRVIASLFSDRAIAYQRQMGYEPGRSKMAVGCMAMVDSASSGVIYSTNPNGDGNTMIINSTWGLGKSVVEGQTDADLYVVRKGTNPEILDIRIGEKTYMITSQNEGGVSTVKVSDEMAAESSLTEEQALELSRQAALIGKHFRKPQDIEWAIDGNGRIFILQARPLPPFNSPLGKGGDGGCEREAREFSNATILMKDRGLVVRKGVGAGRVFILRHMDELDRIPKGSVLVAKHDSSNFVRVMPYVSAIITDTGTPTSHMASLCREFRIPTIVNAGNATQALKHGQEITVNADDGGAAVFEGTVKTLLMHADSNFRRMEDVYEFRRKRYILRYIAPLNLIDPLEDNFTPEGCKTIHDILRFIHEKSVSELIGISKAVSKEHAHVKLDLKIPAGITVIDIGGGLNIESGQRSAAFEDIASIPLKAIIKGMLYPGVWHSDIVSLKAKDFLTSMMRMSDITSDGLSYIENNVAVASKEYMNLSLRFGYHFNVIDCYCSENARNNHIHFRFAGGATDIVKRSRRVELITNILKEYGFNINIKGDLIIARLANIRQDEMENILDQMGRLIAYTRQLDAVLHDDGAVERYSRNFLKENYGL